ncbi:ATP-binding protein [Iodobacter arcticus]|uniref:histidine kinase n=1 Tax=Iodobacter arcticus TaxID=590593 RepID=A0ABW2QXX2_9NEIS
MSAPILINSICSQLPLPAWQKDAKLCYVWANAAWQSFANQHGSDEWLGKNDRDFFSAKIANIIEKGDLLCLENGVSDEEITLKNKTGQEKTMQLHRLPHYDDDGKITGITALAIDITYSKLLLKQMENMMSEMDIQRNALNKNALIAITKESGQFVYVSEPLCLLSGYSKKELMSLTRFDIGLIPDQHFSESIKNLSPLQAIQFETHAKSKNGDDYWLETLLVPMDIYAGQEKNYYEISTNITASKHREETLEHEVKIRVEESHRNTLALEKRNAELITLNDQLRNIQSQLLQSEKLASIGQLAAGIAHEINNPIGYVSSNLGALDGYLSDIFYLIDKYESTIHPHMEEHAILINERKKIDFDFIKEDINSLIKESKEGIKRVKSIVQNLKDFSRIDSNQKWEESDIHAGINSTLNIVQNEIKYKAEVIREYSDLPLVTCVISQLNQIFLNMLVNASHAIEKQGKIYIRTRRKDEQVCISFSDNGKGIAAEHVNRIFDPFFTTKPVGQGTGLGLSLSYGIVKEHHGHIEVHSVLGEGTTFDIWLPIKQE